MIKCNRIHNIRILKSPGFSGEIARQLQHKGHNIRVDLAISNFGRGQMTVRLENGTLVGGTESRSDSNIVCY